MLRKNYIDTANSGLKRIMPNIDFSTICSNYNRMSDISSSEKLDLMKKYLNWGGLFPRGVVEPDEWLDYSYLTSSNTCYDSLQNEIETLISKVKQVGKKYHGHARINASCTWSTYVPTIAENTRLRRALLEVFNRNFKHIVWWTGKVPDNLIKYFEEVAESECIQINENIYIFHLEPENSSLLLITNPKAEASEKIVSKPELDKTIYKFLLKTEEGYQENFCTTSVILKRDEDLLKDILRNLDSDRYIRELIKLDTEIRDWKENYYQLLTMRDLRVSELENLMMLVDDSDKFINTLNKMKDKLKWHITNNMLHIVMSVPLFNYDEHVIKTMFVKGVIDRYAREPWIKELFKECFVSNKLEFLTTTDVCIDFSNNFKLCRSRNYYNVVSSYHTEDQITRLTTDDGLTQFPNPHIARYDCWGQNGPTLLQLLKDRKWEEFVYCLQATLGNLNFNDSAVLSVFTIWLERCYPNQILCKDVETGELLTKEQLIARSIKNEENKDN